MDDKETLSRKRRKCSPLHFGPDGCTKANEALEEEEEWKTDERLKAESREREEERQRQEQILSAAKHTQYMRMRHAENLQHQRMEGIVHLARIICLELGPYVPCPELREVVRCRWGAWVTIKRVENTIIDALKRYERWERTPKPAWTSLPTDITRHIGSFLAPSRGQIYTGNGWQPTPLTDRYTLELEDWRNLTSLGLTCHVWRSAGNWLFQLFLEGRNIVQLRDQLAPAIISTRSINICLTTDVTPPWMDTPFVANLFGVLGARRQLIDRHAENVQFISEIFIAKNDVPPDAKQCVVSANVIDTINRQLGSNLPRFMRNFDCIAKFLLPPTAIVDLLHDKKRANDPFAFELQRPFNCTRSRQARSDPCNGISSLQYEDACDGDHAWAKSTHFALFVTCSTGSLEKWKQYLQMKTIEQGSPKITKTQEGNFVKVYKALNELLPPTNNNNGISLDDIKATLHDVKVHLGVKVYYDIGQAPEKICVRWGFYAIMHTIASSLHFSFIPDKVTVAKNHNVHQCIRKEAHYTIETIESMPKLRRQLARIVEQRQGIENGPLDKRNSRFMIIHKNIGIVCYVQ
jgi:hypothetical protein